MHSAEVPRAIVTIPYGSVSYLLKVIIIIITLKCVHTRAIFGSHSVCFSARLRLRWCGFLPVPGVDATVSVPSVEVLHA